MTEKNEYEIDSWVVPLHLSFPSLQDNTADADRLIQALESKLKTEAVNMDLGLLKELPIRLRDWNYQVKCILFKDLNGYMITGVVDLQSTKKITGLAVDLGTTRVVVRLVDLETKEVLIESSFDNPQIRIGPDILARIHYADKEGGLKELNGLIIDGLNREIENLCDICHIAPEDIYSMAVAGNTAMTHLFMGVNPHFIIREPYIPALNRPGLLKSQELGVKVNPYARVLIFPNIGSYFGGDLISGILYSGMNKSETTSVLVDVGTNAEVVLGNSSWLIACAGAAGPALEGGITKMGMMAGPGVIDKVSIHKDTYEFQIHTIENDPAKGICGSGLIDLVSQLFLAGFVDVRGKFVASVCGDKLKEEEGIRSLVIVPAEISGTGSDISLSQVDLDLFVSSKAAMYTILNTILGSVDIQFEDLDSFYVAGTFGSFINPRSAIDIGMLPDIPIDTYEVLGNSSLGGATLSLTDPSRLDEIDKIRDDITYMELNVNQDFMIKFSGAKFFPNTEKNLFPSVSVWNRNPV